MEERISKIINEKFNLDYSTSNNNPNFSHLDELYQRFNVMYTNNSKKKILNFRHKRNG